MGRHHDVPVWHEGGLATLPEYVSASAQVRLERPPRQGFGRKQPRETYPISDVDRGGRATSVTFEDGRVGRVETWEEEALRLRVELHSALGRVAELTATVARLMVEP
jgi:hypothetical protein